MVKVDEADEVAVEDKANASRLHTTCRTKLKDKVDVATTVVSQLHQEVSGSILEPHNSVRKLERMLLVRV